MSESWWTELLGYILVKIVTFCYILVLIVMCLDIFQMMFRSFEDNCSYCFTYTIFLYAQEHFHSEDCCGER